MEKNKQDLKEGIFIKKYIQELDIEIPKSNFTASIMDTLLKEESKPLISKINWFLIVSFTASCFWFLLKGERNFIVELPQIDLSFLHNIQLPNLFANISISKTLFYAIAFFTAMFFVQLVYLKNHFNKRLE